MEKATKINVGCGNDYRKGYLNVDSNPDCKTDMCCNIKDMLVPPSSVSEIIVSHVVMYLRPEELEPLLMKWHYWLKTGGKIEIETINFDQVLNFALANDKAYGLDCIFGTEKTKTHQWGWNITRLRDLIIKTGFKDIKVSDGSKNSARDFKITAIK
jgi:hypothetical protein